MTSHAKQSLKDKGLTLGCSCTGSNRPLCLQGMKTRDLSKSSFMNSKLQTLPAREQGNILHRCTEKGKVNFIDGRPKKRQILIWGSEKSPALYNKWDLEHQALQGFIT